MRFGLFYEHQIPRPWDEGSEERALRDALEQVELADRIGIDTVWEVEHHFLEEYSHSSAPEVFLAAASQRTSRIRLGHGIVQVPPPYNHPARVAERAATLDLLSGGRVELGTGTSSSQMELGGFGVPREEKVEMWAEAVEAICRMFVEEPFAGYEGRHVKMPPRNVIPKPKQKPHPPLWMACSRRETIAEAGRRGMGALSFSFVEPEDAKPWVDDYHEAFATRCEPLGFDVNPRVAVTVPFFCHRDEETAIARGIDGAHFFGFSLAYYYVFGEHRPGRSDLWRDFEDHRADFGFARDVVRAEGEPLGMRLLEQGLGSLRGAVGTPAQITDLVERYEQAGVDQVIFVAQAGRNRHEQVCESLELFGEQVLPRFAEEADERDRARTERLAPAIERARRALPRPRRAPEYLVTTQGEPAAAPSPNGPPPPAGLRDHVDGAFAGLVSRLDDRRIETVFGEPVLRVLFREMGRRYRPERAAGFRGDVQYELARRGRVHPFVVRVGGPEALAGPGRSPRPALTLRMPVPTFIRILAGDLQAARAAVEGDLEVEGDATLAARLGEMFGQPSPY